MTRGISGAGLVLAFLFCTPAWAGEPLAKSVRKGGGFKEVAEPFLREHCIKCHGATKQAGKVRLDDLTGDVGLDIERWLAVRDQVREGLMPPAKEARPDSTKAQALSAWILAQLGERAAKLPNQGNLIPHELLFGKPATPGSPPPGRIWRLSPDGYLGFVRELRGPEKGIVQPFTMVAERGIKDFAGLYTIDEPSAEILIRNSELIVEALSAHTIKDGKVQGKNDTVREIVLLMNPEGTPTPQQLEAAVQTVFKMALARKAHPDEVARFLGFYEKCAKLGSKPGAVKTMVQAVLLRTDAMFRSELGRGPDEKGRRLLAPEELARALSLALNDRRDGKLDAAVVKGDLQTPEQVGAHVRRILDGAPTGRTKILRFFREYFEYPKALDVFKDPSKDFAHRPETLVSDTDRLIQHLFQEDKDVFRQLLTTDLSFANYSVSKNNKERKEEAKPAVVLNPHNDKGRKPPEFVYGFEQWPKDQPAKVPHAKRLGILMQPAWLIAHATNFDNDPVRRGRWVRERLLGGLVPELPIGVAAQVPDDKHHTFRTRLQVTRDAKCWKCHRMMDDLGLPFEQFNDYGVHRTSELVLDLDATEKNVDKKGKKLGQVFRGDKLDTTGTIADSGDDNLDGPVASPHEMVRRIADSERARQVFIRHAFRFFMGRNETLADAKTLQDADHAYVENGGSFKSLVVALLTSDAFLCRSAPAVAAKTP